MSFHLFEKSGHSFNFINEFCLRTFKRPIYRNVSLYSNNLYGGGTLLNVFEIHNDQVCLLMSPTSYKIEHRLQQTTAARCRKTTQYWSTVSIIGLFELYSRFCLFWGLPFRECYMLALLYNCTSISTRISSCRQNESKTSFPYNREYLYIHEYLNNKILVS